MNKSTIKLLLHPVCIKIIHSLSNENKLTTQKIADYLVDTPQATLYRQLNKLTEAGVIEIIEENQIRGTVEKVYALKKQTIASQEEFFNLSKEEHLQLFLAFSTELIGKYETYLNQNEANLLKDGVMYRMASLNLSDEEFLELIKNISSLIQKASLNKSAPDRKSRNIATIVIPDAEN